MQNYEYISTVGEGAYGEVWKCIEKCTGRLVAVKGFKQAHEDKLIMRLAVREARMLEAVKHPNIVKMLAAFKSKSGRVYLVFEFLEGSVHDCLDRYPQGLPTGHTKVLAWQLLCAAAYLHDNKIIHRDIKPANILLDEEGTVKLCDFGFARSTRCGLKDVQKCTSYIVTRWYRAPEVLIGERYGPCADVWSIGCTIAEIATGRPLFPGDSTADQLWRIMRCLGPLTAAQTSVMAASSNKSLRLLAASPPAIHKTLRQRLPELEPRLLHLVEACLRPDPQQRPTARELLQWPYFWDLRRFAAGTQLEACLGALAAAKDKPQQQQQQQQPTVPCQEALQQQTVPAVAPTPALPAHRESRAPAPAREPDYLQPQRQSQPQLQPTPSEAAPLHPLPAHQRSMDQGAEVAGAPTVPWRSPFETRHAQSSSVLAYDPPRTASTGPVNDIQPTSISTSGLYGAASCVPYGKSPQGVSAASCAAGSTRSGPVPAPTTTVNEVPTLASTPQARRPAVPPQQQSQLQVQFTTAPEAAGAAHVSPSAAAADLHMASSCPIPKVLPEITPAVATATAVGAAATAAAGPPQHQLPSIGTVATGVPIRATPPAAASAVPRRHTLSKLDYAGSAPNNLAGTSSSGGIRYGSPQGVRTVHQAGWVHQPVSAADVAAAAVAVAPQPFNHQARPSALAAAAAARRLRPTATSARPLSGRVAPITVYDSSPDDILAAGTSPSADRWLARDSPSILATSTTNTSNQRLSRIASSALLSSSWEEAMTPVGAPELRLQAGVGPLPHQRPTVLSSTAAGVTVGDACLPVAISPAQTPASGGQGHANPNPPYTRRTFSGWAQDRSALASFGGSTAAGGGGGGNGSGGGGSGRLSSLQRAATSVGGGVLGAFPEVAEEADEATPQPDVPAWDKLRRGGASVGAEHDGVRNKGGGGGGRSFGRSLRSKAARLLGLLSGGGSSGGGGGGGGGQKGPARARAASVAASGTNSAPGTAHGMAPSCAVLQEQPAVHTWASDPEPLQNSPPQPAVAAAGPTGGWMGAVGRPIGKSKSQPSLADLDSASGDFESSKPQQINMTINSSSKAAQPQPTLQQPLPLPQPAEPDGVRTRRSRTETAISAVPPPPSADAGGTARPIRGPALSSGQLQLQLQPQPPPANAVAQWPCSRPLSRFGVHATISSTNLESSSNSVGGDNTPAAATTAPAVSGGGRAGAREGSFAAPVYGKPSFGGSSSLADPSTAPEGGYTIHEELQLPYRPSVIIPVAILTRASATAASSTAPRPSATVLSQEMSTTPTQTVKMVQLDSIPAAAGGTLSDSVTAAPANAAVTVMAHGSVPNGRAPAAPEPEDAVATLFPTPAAGRPDRSSCQALDDRAGTKAGCVGALQRPAIGSGAASSSQLELYVSDALATEGMRPRPPPPRRQGSQGGSSGLLRAGRAVCPLPAETKQDTGPAPAALGADDAEGADAGTAQGRRRAGGGGGGGRGGGGGVAGADSRRRKDPRSPVNPLLRLAGALRKVVKYGGDA